MIDRTLHTRRPDASQEEVDGLLGEIATEFFERISQGESPKIDEYTERHPELADMIRQALNALQVVGDSVAEGKTRIFASGPGDEAVSPNGKEKEKQLGDFRILHELGRGGMGVVYEAEQISMGGRRVALKVLPFAAMADPRQRQRFQNEVRAAASLDHPNIVSVYCVGEDRGVHFYAMRLIRGQSMSQLIHELAEARQHTPLSAESVKQALSSPALAPSSSGNTDPTEAIEQDPKEESKEANAVVQRDTATEPQALISTKASTKRSNYYEAVADLAIQAAEALEHAHQRGVIHRDIKPANLMIDAYSQLYITDFGLAHIEEGIGMTMTGDLIGTLRYMSPEQALGKRVVVDYRTDIYSLGVSLYELLTTQPAFDGENRAALIKQISFEDPEHLTQVDRSIPRDLATIVHKAMEKNPDDRYASAQDIADDLRAFRAFQPINAKPPTWIDRARKFTRRNQGIVAAAMSVLLLSTIGLTISNSMIASQKQAAEEARDAERDQRNEAERQKRLADSRRIEAERLKTEAENRRQEAERLRAESEQQRETTRRNLYVADMQLGAQDIATENIQRLRRRLERYLPTDGQSDLRGWEWYYLLSIGNQSELTLYGHVHDVFDVAWSPNGRWVATVSQRDTSAIIWDTESWTPVRHLDGGRTIYYGAAWSPDSNKFAWGSAAGESAIRIWDRETDRISILYGHESSLRGLAWSPNARYLASTSLDNTCRIWDVEAESCLDTYEISDTAHRAAVVWRSDGEEVCIATGLGITIWNPWSADFRQSQQAQWTGLTCVSYASNDHVILAGNQSGDCIKYDSKTLEELGRCHAHTNCSGLTVVNDQSFATCGGDGVIRVWSLEDLKLLRSFHGHTAGIHSVAADPNGSLLVSASGDGTAKIWAIDSTSHFEVLHPTDPGGRVDNKWLHRVHRLELIPDQDAILYRRKFADTITVPLRKGFHAAADNSSSVFDLRDIPEGTEIEQILRQAAEEIQAVESAPEQSKALVQTSHPTVGMPEEYRKPANHGIVWSPDRSLLLNAVYRDDLNPKHWSIQVWRVSDATLLHTLGPFSSVREVAWSPDGDRLAYVGLEGVIVYESLTGQIIRQINRSDGESVTWHPDGTQFATIHDTGEVACWNTESASPLVSTKAFQSEGVDLRWSPNGTRIAASSQDGSVKILEASSLEELLLLDDADDYIVQVLWCQEGRSLAGLDSEGRIVLWDGNRGYDTVAGEYLVYGLHRNKALEAIRTANFKAAAANFEKMLRLKPQNSQVKETLGVCYFQSGEHQKAVDVWLEYLRDHPNHPTALCACGNAYQILGDLEKAIIYRDLAVKVTDPEDERTMAFVRSCRASTYVEAERWEEAADDLAAAATLPDNALIRTYRHALIRVKLNELETYRDVCGKMISQYDGSTEQQECYFTAWTCVLAPSAVDDFTPVLEFAEQAHELSPSSSSLTCLGAVMLRAGDFKKALEKFEESSGLVEKQADATTSSAYADFFRAMTHQQLGQTSEAKEWLQRAIAAMEEELQKPAVPWNRKLTLELLRNEATELIGMH